MVAFFLYTVILLGRMEKKKIFKKIIETVFFFGVMLLSFYTIFVGQDLPVIWEKIKTMSLGNVFIAALLALGFVSFEGIMIYFLLHSLDKNTRFTDCLDYCFIGFFYSSITPSASGGQPMQLVYMTKDGRKFGSSFVVLMSIATMNKIVLTLLGFGLVIFAKPVLNENLNGYRTLFFIGLGLDFIWVLILVSLMAFTEPLRKLIVKIISFIFRRHPNRLKKLLEPVNGFFQNYQNSLSFITSNPLRILGIFVFSIIQRLLPILITAVVYYGLGMNQTPFGVILIMQAAIYVTVDMLPLPGAQGVTEGMYREVFKNLIPASSIMSSMYITRGINFYFILVFSGLMVLKRLILTKKKESFINA